MACLWRVTPARATARDHVCCFALDADLMCCVVASRRHNNSRRGRVERVFCCLCCVLSLVSGMRSCGDQLKTWRAAEVLRVQTPGCVTELIALAILLMICI